MAEIQIFSDISFSLYNAWILAIPSWILGIIVSRTNKKSFKRATDISWYKTRDKVFSFGGMTLMMVFMILSLYIPIITDSLWFIIGLILFTIGFICHNISKVHYMKAEPKKVIQNGFYQYSRNPNYFFFALILLGVTLTAQSFVLLALWLVIVVSNHIVILGEERYCTIYYGEAYERYKKKVPRYFLFF